MEAEILRQIIEEGLLEGIDLNGIDVTQEDEISELIAQAYRRRQEERRRDRRARDRSSNTNQPLSNRPLVPGEATRTGMEPRQVSAITNVDQHSRPPVSRPQLIDAVNNNQTQQRRSGSQDSARVAQFSRTASEPMSNTPASQSANLGDSSASGSNMLVEGAIARTSLDQRRATDPDRAVAHAVRSTSDGSAPNTPQRSTFPGTVVNPQSHADPNGRRSSRSPRVRAATVQTAATQSTPSLVPSTATTIASSASRLNTSNDRAAIGVLNAPQLGLRPSSSSSAATRPGLFSEPSISCRRCGKPHIEYELHYNCHRCENGEYNICLRCYRSGKGCLHWYGFGWAAWERYGRRAPPEGYPSDHEQPHVLTGHRYLRPSSGPVPPPTQGTSGGAIAAEDPASRLQSGVFCEICHEFANACYWKCDTCNDGAWGYCNRCVNQGRHCTHPLLPLTHTRPTPGSPTSGEGQQRTSQTTSLLPDHAHEPTQFPPLTPKSASILHGPGLTPLANSVFRPLTFSTACDFCTYPIPPSRTRYHCPSCNDGDYDMCASCYTSLVQRGGISSANGHQGWRRCLRGHRMVVVGFEDRDGGQRRVVVRDRVGGVTLREDEAFASAIPKAAAAAALAAAPAAATAATATAPAEQVAAAEESQNWYWSDEHGTLRRQVGGHSRRAFVPPADNQAGFLQQAKGFPPDGGVGLRGVARWGYFPAEGVQDELMFPRGAEIREAEDINHDWFWGVYCGAKGLFPGGYVQILGGE